MEDITDILSAYSHPDLVRIARAGNLFPILTNSNKTYRVATDISIELFGAVGDGETDDSNAINQALDFCLSLHAEGIWANIQLGPKTYLYKTPHAMMTRPVGIIGCGVQQSKIKLDPELVGDVFSWSECWIKTADPALMPAQARLGVTLRGFGVVGDRTAASQQNDFMFYDRNDAVVIEDIDAWFIPGRVLAFGIESATTQAYLRESSIRNFRAAWSGAPDAPVVEFCAVGSGDSTNEVRIFGMDMWSIYGPGLVMRNKNTVKNVSQMDFHSLRIEGYPLFDNDVDLLTIGDSDAAYAGGVSGINFYGLRLLGVYEDQHSFVTKAPDSTAGSKIYQISVHGGTVGPGAGGGFNITAGRRLNFNILDMSVTQTQLTVGAASGGVGNFLRFDSMGNEHNWTKSIDATSALYVQYSKRDNLFATAAPTVDDDVSRFYGVDSLWVIAATGRRYRCVDATDGAARWMQEQPDPGWASGDERLPVGITTWGDGTPSTTAHVVAWPFWTPTPITLSGVNVALVTGQAGAEIMCGIYSNLQGRPSALIADLGILDVSATTGKRTFVTTAKVHGLFWVLIWLKGVATQATFRAPTGYAAIWNPIHSTALVSQTTGGRGLHLAAAYPANMPASAPAVIAHTQSILILPTVTAA